MDFFLNLPAFVKVGLSFFGILIAYRFRLSLGLSILAFSIILTLWTGAGFDGFLYQYHSILLPENYVLLIVIVLLLFFTEALDKTNKMKRTIDALKSWLKSKKLLLVGFPALVGLLPMPGGALFSAPLVDVVDSEKKLKPELKVAINYWFRHIWEYWWPLYPGIILAIKYSTLPSGLFYLIQIPFTFASFAGGYYFIIHRFVPKTQRLKFGEINFKEISQALIPIAILVIVSLIGSFTLPGLGMSKTLANLVAMVIALVLGYFVIFFGKSEAVFQSLKMFKKNNTWEMIFIVLGIELFSTALKIPLGGNEAITLVTGMRDEFLRMGIPILLVIALIPFISAAVTGVAFGFVGASFPIVFALIGPNPHLNVLMATTTFAYGCGYVGMILSPVHSCFVVTNQYFKTSIFSAYKYIFLPMLVILFAGLLMSASYFFLVK
jgi:uncharacterized protein